MLQIGAECAILAQATAVNPHRPGPAAFAHLLDDARGSAEHERAIRNLRPLGDERVGADEAALADARAIEDGGADGEEAARCMRAHLLDASSALSHYIHSL